MTQKLSKQLVKCPHCGNEFATKKKDVTQCKCGKEFKI